MADQGADFDTPVYNNAELRRLISEEALLRLNARSDERGLQQVAFHVACLLASAVWIGVCRYGGVSWPWLALGLVLHSFFLSFLFMPLHECVHKTAFSAPWLNTVGGVVTGLLTLRPPVHYKYYHFAHHRYTGDKKKDPELQGTLIDLTLDRISHYFLYLSGLPFWLDRTTTLYRHAVYAKFESSESYISTDTAKSSVVFEARLFVGAYLFLALLSIYYRSGALMWYWVVPSVIGQVFLRFYLIAEHNGCESSPSMLTNTRTTRSFPFYTKLAWNMPYHAEHHAFPTVPFWSLPEVYSEMKGISTAQGGCKPSGAHGYWAIHFALVRKFFN